ncbi:RDD family protein [Helicobacter cholecystus]|uniref:RDD family protein n=1 Tax=Helicobacter cholecystus TaxID=45498 RepID=A0A3D8IWS4_9HELI|nr:RDD family protein [Helicobacter cholecystus]RDU69430.1 RDD family protein [Helicobacter cholecystus]VEJ23978.1 Putative integral membrane protein [Helicobacter cholecystus]
MGRIKSPAPQVNKKTSQFFFLRFKAFVIDLFMIYTPILYITTYVILGSKEALWANQGAIFICWFLYALIDSLFCSIVSQTPGMRAQELVLKDQQGNKLGFFRCFLRFFVWLSSLGLVFGFVFPLFRKDRMSFQDWLCQTKIEISPHKPSKN